MLQTPNPEIASGIATMACTIAPLSSPFARLAKGEETHTSGLGLSLVAAIARLHRARLALESNEPGLRVVVELPLEQAD